MASCKCILSKKITTCFRTVHKINDIGFSFLSAMYNAIKSMKYLFFPWLPIILVL